MRERNRWNDVAGWIAATINGGGGAGVYTKVNSMETHKCSNDFNC